MTTPLIRAMTPDDSAAVADLCDQLGYPVDSGRLAHRFAQSPARGTRSSSLRRRTPASSAGFTSRSHRCSRRTWGRRSSGSSSTGIIGAQVWALRCCAPARSGHATPAAPRCACDPASRGSVRMRFTSAAATSGSRRSMPSRKTGVEESMLDSSQVRQFMEDGFVKVEGAFSRDVADACVEILWRDTGCDRHDPATWTKPVIRLGDYGQEPFRLAANTPALHEAFDQLVGAGRWAPRTSLGTFPIRFPSDEDPGDAGWHTDASFYGADQSPRLNLMSHGRALLMLFLFSPVGVDDAPTRIRVGSHLDIPPLLVPAGDAGLWFRAGRAIRRYGRTFLDDGHRPPRRRLPVSPVPRACRATPSWLDAPHHGSAAALSGRRRCRSIALTATTR